MKKFNYNFFSLALVVLGSLALLSFFSVAAADEGTTAGNSLMNIIFRVLSWPFLQLFRATNGVSAGQFMFAMLMNISLDALLLERMYAFVKSRKNKST